MKRIICVILSAVLAFSVFFNMNLCVNGVSAEEKDACEFAEEIGEMIEKASLDFDSADEANTVNNEFKTCRLIVKTAGKLNTLNAVSFVNGYNNIWILQFNSIESTCSAFEFYSKQTNIDFVEADKVISVSDAGDSFTLYGEPDKGHLSWGPDFLGIDKFNNSLISSGKQLANITVAVIDSGIESKHEFLDGRVIPTNVNTSGSGERNSSEDDFGHGTQVAGVIADSTLENVLIKPYKVLDNFGQGTLVSVAAGINCAINDNVDIINLSLGFYEDSVFFEETIKKAIAKDITVVGAAGNSSTDEPYFPSSYSGVIRVSAINSSGVIANFSNYGDITFSAPGVNINSSTIGNNYTVCKGTSFAAPFCSAIAAAVKSVMPLAPSEDVIDVLKTYSVLPVYNDSEKEMGFGIIYAPQDFENKLSGKTEAPGFITQAPSIALEPFKLDIKCKTPNSVIYYTTDGSIPLCSNPKAVIYDGNPITISESCCVYAVAYSEGRFRSAVTGYNAVIAPNIPQDELSINADGIITEYRGNAASVSIPKTVNSITVKGIGDNTFNGKNLKIIVAPNEVVSFGNGTFEDCRFLEFVIAEGVTAVGDRCFRNCVLADTFNLGELTTIGASAFENVCSGSNAVFGKTFSIDAENLAYVPENAFRSSAISEIKCKNISSISKNSFSECDSLVNVDLKTGSNIPEGCFKGCNFLENVSISGLKAISSSCFADCPMLTNVNLPDAELLLPYSFARCISLKKISLPNVISMFSNAFADCCQLREIELSSLEYFEDTPASAPEFPENLKSFIAPRMKKTLSDMFGNSKEISEIYLNSVTDIAEYTFRGCNGIYYLNLESVTNLKKNSLAECSAEFIDLSRLITADSLPDNSGIMLSNSFIETTCTADNLTLYGSPSSFVERYAQYKGYGFIPLPIISNEIPQNIISSSELISVSAIGYNLEYQWFSNTENSNENGIPIAGATQASYLFTEKDTAPFYYCVVTQNDSGTVSKAKTSVIVNDTTPADYTEYEKAVEKAQKIDRTLYIDTSALDHALSKNVYGRYKCEQNIVDEQTKIILDAINNLEMNVVKKIYLFSSKTDLYLFSGIQAIIMILPEGAIYDNIEWSSSNSSAFTVNKSGYVRCVGNGKATITATVYNPDGSTACASLEFEKKLLGIEKIFSFFFKWIFILISDING